MEKLKPCPFCGHTPSILSTSFGRTQEFDTKTYKIICPYCGCNLHDGRSCVVRITYSPMNGATADETELNKLIEEWNRRGDNELHKKNETKK